MDRANPLRRQHAQLNDLDDAVGAKPASFEELYERHRLDVYRYLRAWGSSEDEAADLTAATFERAIQAAVPALLAAFGANANKGTGMREAIERDHDGSILDDLAGYLGGTAQLSPRTTNGTGILEHTLGDRQPEVQQALSAKSGLDTGSIGNLLAVLAPIVMGMLGKRGGASGGSGGSGGFGLDDIGDLLNREKTDARTKNPDIGDVRISSRGRRAEQGAMGLPGCWRDAH